MVDDHDRLVGAGDPLDADALEVALVPGPEELLAGGVVGGDGDVVAGLDMRRRPQCAAMIFCAMVRGRAALAVMASRFLPSGSIG